MINADGQMFDGMTNIANWVENTGDTDHWRLVNKADGSFGWREDGIYDFNIDKVGTITAENMQKYVMIMNTVKEMGIQGSLPITIGNKKETVLRSGERSMTEMLARTVITDPKQLETYGEFLKGTGEFANASVAAKELTELLNKDGNKTITAVEREQIGKTLGTFIGSLYNAQESGLLVKNDYTVDLSGLVGSGTEERPYLPVRADKNGKIYITGYEGFRLVEDGMLPGNSNFAPNSFAANKHNAVDFVGGGDVIASVGGNLKMNYDNSFGLQAIILGSKTAENSHTGSQTVKNWLGLFGSAGVNMTNTSGGYMLNGIKAGSVIGQQGNTGRDSGGVHVHSQLKGNGWNDLLNDPYSGSVTPTDYAWYMTGYVENSFSSDELWTNVQTFSERNPSLLDYNAFFNQNYDKGPSWIQKEGFIKNIWRIPQ